MTAYGYDCNQSTLAEESARGSSQMGFFVHELRNLLQTVTIAFEVLKKGNVGLAGSTAAVISLPWWNCIRSSTNQLLRCG